MVQKPSVSRGKNVQLVTKSDYVWYDLPAGGSHNLCFILYINLCLSPLCDFSQTFALKSPKQTFQIVDKMLTEQLLIIIRNVTKWTFFVAAIDIFLYFVFPWILKILTYSGGIAHYSSIFGKFRDFPAFHNAYSLTTKQQAYVFNSLIKNFFQFLLQNTEMHTFEDWKRSKKFRQIPSICVALVEAKFHIPRNTVQCYQHCPQGLLGGSAPKILMKFIGV